MGKAVKHDEIGYWSEVKLDIIREYARAYSTILFAQTSPSFDHVYIDAFAGAGKHLSKTTGDYVLGSPANALLVKPPFKAYHLIDIKEAKVAELERLAASRSDVHVYPGDCNRILLESVFPQVQWSDFKRGLCILDPYGLHLDWEVVYTAGQMRSIDIFLNFPVADMNRNVLWRNREGVAASQIERMNRFWGDDSWESDAYRASPQMRLFGEAEPEKASNDASPKRFARG